MKDAGKEVSSEELLIVFEMLRDNGHLDYETHGVDSSLTSYELDRYSRNLNYFSWVDVSGVSQHVTQKRLLDSSVLILGAGGIGSAIACSLAAMGIGKIRVIDFDVVELSNLNRQIAYSEADIGRFKIDALSDRILQINSKCNLSTKISRIETADDINALLDGSEDIIVLSADTPINLPFELGSEPIKPLVVDHFH